MNNNLTRVGHVLKIQKGDLAGFSGEVVYIDHNQPSFLLVDMGTKETHWFSVDGMNDEYGDQWFTQIETEDSVEGILRDVIADWENNELHALRFTSQEIVQVLVGVLARIEALDEDEAAPSVVYSTRVRERPNNHFCGRRGCAGHPFSRMRCPS